MDSKHRTKAPFASSLNCDVDCPLSTWPGLSTLHSVFSESKSHFCTSTPMAGAESETQGRDVKRVLERYAAFTHNAQYLYNHLSQFPLPMTPSLTVQWLGGPSSAGNGALDQHVMYGSQNSIIPSSDEPVKAFRALLHGILNVCRKSHARAESLYERQVDRSIVPDYGKFVFRKHEMWLGKVEERITDGTYTSVAMMQKDMDRVLANARSYNKPNKHGTRSFYGSQDVLDVAIAIIKRFEKEVSTQQVVEADRKMQERKQDSLFISRVSVPIKITTIVDSPPDLTPVVEFWHDGDVEKARAMAYTANGPYLAAVLSSGRRSVSIYDLRAGMEAGCDSNDDDSAGEGQDTDAAVAMDVDGPDGHDAANTGGGGGGGGGKRRKVRPGPLLDLEMPAPVEGLGLAWGASEQGLLLCSFQGGGIALHRLGGGSSSGGGSAAGCSTSTGSRSGAVSGASCDLYEGGHAGQWVNDLAFNPHQPEVFASVGEDGGLAIWDIRHGGAGGPREKSVPWQSCRPVSSESQGQQQQPEEQAGTSTSTGPSARQRTSAAAARLPPTRRELNSVSWNTYNSQHLAVCGGDGLVRVLDSRKLGDCLYTLYGHRSAVMQVAWDPHHANVLAAADLESRVVLWDLDRIQSHPDGIDATPKLLFAHAGHCGQLTEFAWNPEVPWTLASVSGYWEGPWLGETPQDNVLQLWRPCDEALLLKSGQDDADRDQTNKKKKSSKSAVEN